MKFKTVKLKKLNAEYKKLDLNVGTLGIIISESDGKALTMFINSLNKGDFLVANVNKSDLQVTDIVLPNNICAELEEYIEKNANKIVNKTTFKKIPFDECDYVQLIVEKRQYAKFGLHKGATGVVASNKATTNKILVDFGIDSQDFDGFVCVDFEDIKKVQ